MRVLAEIIASDVSLLVTFSHAIDGVLQKKRRPRANPSVGAVGRIQEAANEFSVGESSAVRDGENCESGKPARNHRRNERPRRQFRRDTVGGETVFSLCHAVGGDKTAAALATIKERRFRHVL